MKFSQRAAIGAVLAASLVGLSSFAIAQDATTAPDAQRQAWMQQRQARVIEMQAAASRRLHDILNLRSDQDGALSTLIAALAPTQHKDGARDGAHKDLVSLTTPQRLDLRAARMAEHEAAFQRRAAAIKQFYAALTPEQQRAFDALPEPMEGGGHRGFGDHRMGDGPSHGHGML